jgi:hypothetical protein
VKVKPPDDEIHQAGIKLNKNGRISFLLSDDTVQIQFALQLLRGFSILTDFHKMYTIDRVLGEGANAKVKRDRFFSCIHDCH